MSWAQWPQLQRALEAMKSTFYEPLKNYFVTSSVQSQDPPEVTQKLHQVSTETFKKSGEELAQEAQLKLTPAPAQSQGEAEIKSAGAEIKGTAEEKEKQSQQPLANEHQMPSTSLPLNRSVSLQSTDSTAQRTADTVREHHLLSQETTSRLLDVHLLGTTKKNPLSEALALSRANIQTPFGPKATHIAAKTHLGLTAFLANVAVDKNENAKKLFQTLLKSLKELVETVDFKDVDDRILMKELALLMKKAFAPLGGVGCFQTAGKAYPGDKMHQEWEAEFKTIQDTMDKEMFKRFLAYFEDNMDVHFNAGVRSPAGVDLASTQVMGTLGILMNDIVLTGSDVLKSKGKLITALINNNFTDESKLKEAAQAKKAIRNNALLAEFVNKTAIEEIVKGMDDKKLLDFLKEQIKACHRNISDEETGKLASDILLKYKKLIGEIKPNTVLSGVKSKAPGDWQTIIGKYLGGDEEVREAIAFMPDRLDDKAVIDWAKATFNGPKLEAFIKAVEDSQGPRIMAFGASPTSVLRLGVGVDSALQDFVEDPTKLLLEALRAKEAEERNNNPETAQLLQSLMMRVKGAPEEQSVAEEIRLQLQEIVGNVPVTNNKSTGQKKALINVTRPSVGAILRRAGQTINEDLAKGLDNAEMKNFLKEHMKQCLPNMFDDYQLEEESSAILEDFKSAIAALEPGKIIEFEEDPTKVLINLIQARIFEHNQLPHTALLSFKNALQENKQQLRNIVGKIPVTFHQGTGRKKPLKEILTMPSVGSLIYKHGFSLKSSVSGTTADILLGKVTVLGKEAVVSLLQPLLDHVRYLKGEITQDPFANTDEGIRNLKEFFSSVSAFMLPAKYHTPAEVLTAALVVAKALTPSTNESQTKEMTLEDKSEEEELQALEDLDLLLGDFAENTLRYFAVTESEKKKIEDSLPKLEAELQRDNLKRSAQNIAKTRKAMDDLD